jgi:hypothetical protein
VRNFLRIVDFLPAFYVVGVISILATNRNQRLGDLAAGTLVVRERRPVVMPARLLRRHRARRSWRGLSGVSVDDVATLRQFLERRISLSPRRALILRPTWGASGRRSSTLPTDGIPRASSGRGRSQTARG